MVRTSKPLMTEARRRSALRASLPANQQRAVRERRLIRLGYRAMAIGFNKAHLGDGWVRHFGARAERLFELSLAGWLHA